MATQRWDLADPLYARFERIARYRQMAASAHHAAGSAKSNEVRDTFIGIAVAWTSLADEIEFQPFEITGGPPKTSPERRHE
jgi:hypothetical protein